MFTGIVEKTVGVLAAVDSQGLRRLALGVHWPDARLGESIAINGCCLTVAEIGPDSVSFDVVRETLDKTNLGMLQVSDQVNVERSLRIGDRLDGHFVQGHIDGRALLIEARSDGDERRLTVQSPPFAAKYLVPKGSITLDGVSLTLASVRDNLFEVVLIPTTTRLTTLGSRKPGWQFNLETDILSKTVVGWLEGQKGSSN